MDWEIKHVSLTTKGQRRGKRDRVGGKLNESLFIKRFAARTKLTLGNVFVALIFLMIVRFCAVWRGQQKAKGASRRTDNSPARFRS